MMKSPGLLARGGAFVLIAALAAGCGSQGQGTGPTATTAATASTAPNADGVVPGAIGAIPEITAYDPNALAPSAGAAALQALAAIDPGVAGLESDVSTAERAALKQALASLPYQPTGGVRTGITSGGSPATAPWSGSPEPAASSVVVLVVARPSTARVAARVAAMAAAPAAGADRSADSASFLVALVSGISDLWTPFVPAGGAASGSGTDTEAGSTSTMSLDIGRSKDGGSTNFGIGIKTDASKGGVTAKLDTAASVSGLRCPDPTGRVDFTVKVRLGADSGATALTQELTANVKTTVNDDASIGAVTLDVVQGTRRVQNGRQVYVETGVTSQFAGHDYAAAQFSNLHLVRSSQDTTATDVSELSYSGHTAAQRMGLTALFVAESNWRDGGCVKIAATSPGQVEPGSSTAIPVAVTGRFDGADVPSKLEVVLQGGASVNPMSLPKTPGSLTYKAPDERNKTATIALTATSRRGIAKLALTATTGSTGYTASGGGTSSQGGTITISGTVADLNAPFTLDGVFPGGGATLSFTPSSDRGGTYTFAGGFGLSGGGTYTIVGDAGGPLTLTYVGSGCVGAGACSSTTAEVTLTPQK